jgi:hypothetical protein
MIDLSLNTGIVGLKNETQLQGELVLIKLTERIQYLYKIQQVSSPDLYIEIK